MNSQSAPSRRPPFDTPAAAGQSLLGWLPPPPEGGEGEEEEEGAGLGPRRASNGQPVSGIVDGEARVFSMSGLISS